MATRNPGGRPKGTPKTGGRKRGTPNKATAEAKAACAEIVDDVTYRRRLLARARAGTLAPGVEQMLWYFAKGKPADRTEVGQPGEFDSLSDEELASRIKAAAAKLDDR